MEQPQQQPFSLTSSTDSLPSLQEGKLVRVYLMDDSFRGFPVTNDTTIKSLKATLVERLGINFHDSFAILEKKDDWERMCKPNEKVVDIIAHWEKVAAKESYKQARNALIFKKYKYLAGLDDQELLDIATKNAVYNQAVWNVLESDYPCTAEEAVVLAGLEAHIVYGDYKASVHSSNFLIKNLKQFVPKDLLANKKPAEWEILIFKQHAAHVGKPVEKAKSEYLAIVRLWPLYGTTFFPLCRTFVSNSKKGKMRLGINSKSIILVKKKEKAKEQSSTTLMFTELSGWTVLPNQNFQITVQVDAQTYTFETAQGQTISSLMMLYVDVLLQELKCEDPGIEVEELAMLEENS